MIWHDFIFVQFFYISKTCTGVCRIFIYTTHNPKAKLWCALLRISPRLKLLQVKSVLATFARLSYQKNSSFPSIQTVLKVKHIHSALVRKKRKQSSMFLFHKSSYSPEFRLRNIAMIMLVEFEESTRGATAWMDHKFTSITYGLWFRRGCFHDSIGLYMHILKNVQCSKIRKLHQNQYQVNWAAVLKPFIRSLRPGKARLLSTLLASYLIPFWWYSSVLSAMLDPSEYAIKLKLYFINYPISHQVKASFPDCAQTNLFYWSILVISILK